MGAQPASGVYALLADGTTVEIRPATTSDFDAVWQMHRAMSPDNIYLRFFSLAGAKQAARRICREPAADHAALLACLAGELIGVACYETGGRPDTAEIAFAVADHAHQRGVATLLLEHLVSIARDRGVRTFTAVVMAENYAMLNVFADAGLHARRKPADGVTELAFDLPGDVADPGWGPYLDAVAERESRADAASLRHIFAAESVAVVGASRRPESVGRAILHNLVTNGYTGQVYAVNPHASELEGVPCLPSPAALPGPVDVAVVVVPRRAVLDVAEECGKRGVKALVVITSGLDRADKTSLLACCRQHGMRLIGPNCFGIAVPGIGLDATFGARHPAAGKAGLAVQPGGLGIALCGQLSRLGIGISSFASLGDKCDVSGNDLLMWWEQDPATKLAMLYLESLGNPRKFGRIARHAGATMPVLTVHAGRSEAGRRAAASHTAAAATPLVTRQALFAQAGVIATRDIGELLDAAALLASQPVPAGGRVAIVSNAGGAGMLAADACTDAGLHVATLGGQIQDALRRLLPPAQTSPAPSMPPQPSRPMSSAAAWNRSRPTMRWTPSWCSPCPPLSPILPPWRAPRRSPSRSCCRYPTRPKRSSCCPGHRRARSPPTPTRRAPPARWPTPAGMAPGAPAGPAASPRSVTCGALTRERSSAPSWIARRREAGSAQPKPLISSPVTG